MVCLCLTWHEVREDHDTYWVVLQVCDSCGKILDRRTENK